MNDSFEDDFYEGSRKQSSTNRLETFFGDTGAKPGTDFRSGNLQLFSGRYRFMDRTWGIHIWAVDQKAAEEHCAEFGMTFDGKIEEII